MSAARELRPPMTKAEQRLRKRIRPLVAHLRSKPSKWKPDGYLFWNVHYLTYVKIDDPDWKVGPGEYICIHAGVCDGIDVRALTILKRAGFQFYESWNEPRPWNPERQIVAMHFPIDQEAAHENWKPRPKLELVADSVPPVIEYSKLPEGA